MKPQTFVTVTPEQTTGLYFLVDFWPDGHVEMAFRRNPGDTWSLPETLVPAKASAVPA